MTLDEAKDLYFSYLGFMFHVGREEPEKYDSFRMLDIKKDTLKQWDEELLDGLFANLWTKPDRIWSLHSRIIGIIRRGYCDTERYLGRLLDEMERMEGLSPDQLTIIIENMAGRNEPLNDGGVYIFSRHHGFGARMNDIVWRLIAARSAYPDPDGRFSRAVLTYRKSCSKWSVTDRSAP